MPSFALMIPRHAAVSSATVAEVSAGSGCPTMMGEITIVGPFPADGLMIGPDAVDDADF